MAGIVAERILEALRSGEVSDREDLQRLKMKLCARYGAEKVPSNSEVLALVTEEERRGSCRCSSRSPCAPPAASPWSP
jgi:elongator complex protein 3